MLAFTQVAQAQVQRNFVNLGFEQPAIPSSPCRLYIAEDQVPGWTTSHPFGNTERVDNCGNFTLNPTFGRLIELWKGPRQNVSARQGTQFAELNAVVASRISQTVCLEAGEQIAWHFSHRGRDSATIPDQAEFLIGSQQIVQVATTNSGIGRLVAVTVGTAGLAPGGGGWVDYSGSFAYPGSGGQTNIGFGTVSSATGDPTSGNFIDNIDVTLKPFVEFAAGSYSTLEGATGGLPMLRISGTVPNVGGSGGMIVHVHVVAPSANPPDATLGTDYTTPGNAIDFDVKVPAGDYGTGTSVALQAVGGGAALASLTDALAETDENVVLQLLPPNTATDSYLVDSTQVCSSAPITQTIWTIRDNHPALQLTKTAVVVDNIPRGPSAGDVIRYSFTVSNTGNVPLTNITVTDTLPGIVFATPARSIPTLAVGATDSTTFANYASYTVTAADITATQVTNTATAHGLNGGSPVNSNPSSVTMPLVAQPSMVLTKTAVYDDGNRGFAQVGDPIAYTFRLTNTGNVTITNVIVTDTMTAPAQWPASLTPITCPDIEPGAGTVTCTVRSTSPVTYNINSDDINAGRVVNSAVANGSSSAGAIASNQSTTTTPLVQAARLVLDKSAGNPTAQRAGATIPYTFKVTNTGNVPLNTLTIIDPQLSAPATCGVTTLAVGATTTCTGNHVITQQEMDAGLSTNTAQARGLTPTAVAALSPPDSTTTPLQPVRSIAVDKKVIRSQISGPTTMTYTIDVTNTGTASFTSLTGVDTLPTRPGDPVSTVNVTTTVARPVDDGDSLFEPGEVWSYQVTYPVDQARIDSGEPLVNSVTMTGTTAAGGTASGTDTASTTIIRSPSMSLTKLVGRQNVTSAGTSLSYVVTMRNTGNLSLSVQSIVDQLSQGATSLPTPTLLPVAGAPAIGTLPQTLDVGEAWTYLAQRTVTQANIDDGENIVNRVDVNALTPRGNVLAPTAEATTSVTTTAAMRVTKQVDKSEISGAGPLNYSVVISNTGGRTLHNIQLTDVFDPPGAGSTTLTPPTPVSSATNAPDTAGILDVGETWTYTIPVTVTETQFQQWLAAGGNIVNSATPTALDPDGATITPSPATATAVTELSAHPALHLEKKVDRAIVAGSCPPGDDSCTIDELDYTITIENTGNQDLTIASGGLTDSLSGGSHSPTALDLTSQLTLVSGDTNSDGKISVGETWTYAVVYDVIQADIDAAAANVNTITNTVTLQTVEIATPSTASASTLIETSRQMRVTKTADATSVTAPGPINYFIHIHNIGNVQLANVSASDTLTKSAGGSTAIALTGPFSDANGDNLPDDLRTCPVMPPTVANPCVLGPDGVSDPGDWDGDGLLDAGGQWLFLASYTVTQADISNAAVSGTNVLTNTVTASATDVAPQTDAAITTVLANASYSLLKTVDIGTTPAPGLLSYTITLTNTGNTELTGVAIDDTLTSGAHPSPGIPLTLSSATESIDDNDIVDIGETWTWTTQYTATQADIDAGLGTLGVDITNSVRTTTNEVTTPQTSTAITDVAPTARLLALKYPDKSQIAEPGDITYTVVVYNGGTTTLSNIDLHDVLPDGTTLPMASISAPVSNFSTDSDPSNDALAGNATLDVGEYFTYSVTFTVTPQLFACAVAGGGTCLPPTWTVGDPIPPAPFQLINVVDPTATAPDGTTVSAPRALGITNVLAQPEIDVEKHVDKPTIGSPTTLNYTITVTNAGNQSLSGVALTDALTGGALPGAMPLTLSGPTGDAGTPNVIDVGESWTYTASYNAIDADITAGNDLVNTVSVVTNEIAGPTTATATTVIAPSPLMSVEKTVDKSSIAGVEPLAYTITVQNIGNMPLHDVSLADTLPDGTTVLTGTNTPALATPASGDTNTNGILDLGETWTYSLSYTPPQAVFDSTSQLINTVGVTATPSFGSAITASASATTLAIHDLGLDLVKTASFGDDGDGLVSPEDRINYTFTVTNTGNSTLTDVSPRDDGVSFGGVPGSGVLSSFSPSAVTLAPGASQVFTASYAPTLDDLDNAAGVVGGVENTADAVGYFNHAPCTTPGCDPDAISAPSTALLTLGAQKGAITITKRALVNQIRRGETVPFVIAVENRGKVQIDNAQIVDRLPPAFEFVAGSATLNGAAATPTVSGRTVTFDNVTLAINGRIEIGLTLRSLPTASPGLYTNIASILSSAGLRLAPDAKATVEIAPEAVFDCSEVIGKVFNDANRNGTQDEGEVGLPGVRVATVRGTLITTDAFGRYSIPCAALPNPEIGSNFVLKLDVRTLPTGFALTTENPAMARLTAGKMTEINFGASIGREVRIDLDARAFAARSTEPGKALQQALDQLVSVLKQQPARLTLSYTGAKGDAFGQRRLQRLEQLVRERWHDIGEPYALIVNLDVLER